MDERCFDTVDAFHDGSVLKRLFAGLDLQLEWLTFEPLAGLLPLHVLHLPVDLLGDRFAHCVLLCLALLWRVCFHTLGVRVSLFPNLIALEVQGVQRLVLFDDFLHVDVDVSHLGVALHRRRDEVRVLDGRPLRVHRVEDLLALRPREAQLRLHHVLQVLQLDVAVAALVQRLELLLELLDLSFELLVLGLSLE